jgi:hypothetical protein
MNLDITMKHMNPIVTSAAFLLLFSSPLFAAPPAAPEKKPATTEKALPQEFPLVIKGKEITISPQAKRAELESALTKLLGAKTELEEPSMLQYDVQLDPSEGPVTVVLFWSKTGALQQVSLDAYMESQNPPAKELKRWLSTNAGPGKTTKNKEEKTTTTIWTHRSWRFVFTEGGDGEDSEYSFEITPIKAK